VLLQLLITTYNKKNFKFIASEYTQIHHFHFEIRNYKIFWKGTTPSPDFSPVGKGTPPLHSSPLGASAPRFDPEEKFDKSYTAKTL